MQKKLGKEPRKFSDTLSNDHYHRLKAISATQLPIIKDQTIEHLEVDRKATRAMEKGIMVHDFLEMHKEKDKFLEKYVTHDKIEMPQGRNTKAGKALYQQYLLDSANHEKMNSEEWQHAYVEYYFKKKLVDEKEYELLKAIQRQLGDHPFFESLLEKGIPERSYVAKCDYDIAGRARPDLSMLEEGILCDFKTTDNASVEAFSKKVIRYKYHWAGAFHSMIVERAMGIKIKHYVWIAIENKPPYGINPVYMPEPMRDAALATIDRILLRYNNLFRPMINVKGYRGYTSDFKKAICYPSVLNEFETVDIGDFPNE